MQATVKVFTVAPSAPTASPRRGADFLVEAKTHDGLRQAAREKFAAQGLRLQALSFTPAGLLAYVEASQGAS